MLRVLILASWYPKSENDPSGRFILSQAQALQSSADVRLMDVSHRFSLIPKPILIRMQARKILKKLNRGGWTPDIIHAHVAYPAGEIALLLKKHFKSPVFLTEHTGPIHLLFKYFGSAKRFFTRIQNFDLLITVSSFLRSELLRGDPRPKNVQVIGNIVDSRFFSIPLSEPREKTPKIAFIGRLTQDKGVPELLLALKTYERRASQKIQICLLGDGPLKFEIERAQKDFSQVQIEILSPEQHSVESVLQECRFLILPSRIETFSLVAAEALALGRPVLGFKCGGPEDFVREKMGTLLPERDPEALAKEIENFLSQESWSLKPKLMEMKREEIRKLYSAQAISQKLLDLYAHPTQSD